MARPRKTQVEQQWQEMTSPAVDEEKIYQSMAIEIQEDEPVEETAVDRIAQMLKVATDSDRADLKVYRFKEGVMQYCASYKPEAFEDGSFDLLRKRFGAGDYEIRLYATDPNTRKFVVRARTRLSIADDKTNDAPEGLPTGMSQVLGAIADGQRQMLEALVAMKSQPAKDPMEEMTKMLSMMTMMREAMGMNSGSQQKSSIGEIVDAIKELRAASSIIENEKDEEENVMKMLPQVLELVKAGVISQPQTPQPLAAVIPPVSLAPDLTTQQLQEQTQEDDPQNLRGLLGQLLAIKGSENDIPAAAMFIYEEMPDNIVEIMFSGVWWLALSAAAPEVKPHKEWLTNVRTVAMQFFEQGEEDSEKVDEPPKAA